MLELMNLCMTQSTQHAHSPPVISIVAAMLAATAHPSAAETLAVPATPAPASRCRCRGREAGIESLINPVAATKTPTGLSVTQTAEETADDKLESGSGVVAYAQEEETRSCSFRRHDG